MSAAAHKIFSLLAAIIIFGLLSTAACCAQGVATGGAAVPAKPLPAGIQPPHVQYLDVAAQAGLTGKNISGAEHDAQYIVETTGTGVAIVDYDNDGLPDILLVNADRLQKNGPAPTHFLYHNLGGLKFEDVTEKAGLTHTGWSQGVCAGDIDNDGNVDVFVTQWGQNALYRNQGNGTFKDETKDRGLSTPKPRWSTGCAFVDFNRDGHLDLVVSHYVDFDLAKTPRPGDQAQCMWKGLPVMCGPRGLPGETVTLYENDGHGHFSDVSGPMHITGPRTSYGFSVLTGDFDNDGWPDIYVVCDSTPSLYYHNQGGKGFEEMGPLAGVAYNEDGREQAGMGATAGDVTGDGLLDIFKTNFIDDTHSFYRNLGKNSFEDATIPSGLAANTKYLGWGTAFLDIDNDGWKDLIVANGHVYPTPAKSPTGEKFNQRRLLYWNRRDGQFFDLSESAGAGISAEHSSRGLAVGDLDNDGDPEIVIVNLNELPTLLKNVAPRLGNSILIRAVTANGSDAIGSRITVRTGDHEQMDEVRSGGSFMSQNDFRLHFGVGSANTADVSIRWPDGTIDQLDHVAANEIVTVQQHKGIIHKQPFASFQKTLP